MLELDTLPNIEADLIEQHIGLTFKEKPLKVPFTFKNAVKLFFRHSLGKQIASSIVSGRAAGHYLESHNLYIYIPSHDEERDLRIGIHENGHALVHEINPRILHADNHLKAYFVFEGIPEWISAETIARHRGLSSPAEIRQFHEAFYDNSSKFQQTGWAYDKGYPMIRKTMIALLEEGLSPAEALVRIILNPSIAIDEPIDPALSEQWRKLFGNK